MDWYDKIMSKKALYPYTLQPVALNMNEAEFRTAQLALFNQTAQNYNLKSLRPKEWLILGVITALAVAGLIFVNGYSVILFWLMLIGVIVYLLLRTLGLKWYMQKEYEKQVATNQIPEQMLQMKLGVQPHGIIMSLPAPTTTVPMQMRGMTMKAAPVQQAVIAWDSVTSWDETDDFVFIMFDIKGQKGSQIIPKRLKANQLPIDTIIKHLGEITPKGLKAETLQDIS